MLFGFYLDLVGFICLPPPLLQMVVSCSSASWLAVLIKLVLINKYSLLRAALSPLKPAQKMLLQTKLCQLFNCNMDLCWKKTFVKKKKKTESRHYSSARVSAAARTWTRSAVGRAPLASCNVASPRGAALAGGVKPTAWPNTLDLAATNLL